MNVLVKDPTGTKVIQNVKLVRKAESIAFKIVDQSSEVGIVLNVSDNIRI